MAPRFSLEFSPEAAAQLAHLEKTDKKKHKRVLKSLGLLEVNPKHPGLHSHRYKTKTGPGAEPLFEAYVENNTPAAYRIFYYYKKGTSAVIMVAAITSHP